MRHRSGSALMFAVLGLGSADVAAQQYTWVGPPSGDWHIAPNWSTGTVPNSSTADVFVDGGATGAVTVILNTDARVRSLQVSAADQVVVQGSGTDIFADVVQVDGGLLYLRGPQGGLPLLDGGTVTTSGTGQIRGDGYCSVLLRNAIISADIWLTHCLLIFEGTIMNQAMQAGAHKIRVTGETGFREIRVDGVTRITAPVGTNGELIFTGTTVSAETGGLTLGNQRLTGGELVGTFFNGDANGPSRMTGVAIGRLFGPAANVTQSAGSEIVADSPGLDVYINEGAVVTGGKLVSANGGRFLNNGIATLDNLTLEGFLEASALVLNNVINSGTIRCSGSILNATGGNFSHGVLEFLSGPSTVTFGQPLVLRSAGMLRVQGTSYTAEAGTDLTATEGGILLADTNGQLRNAANKDLRADNGGLIHARDSGQVFANTGNVIVGPGGFAGVDGGNMLALSGFVRADGGTLFGRGAMINIKMLNAGELRPGDTVDYLAPAPIMLANGIGSLTVGGTFEMDSTSRLIIDTRPSSTGAPVVADLVDVSGPATLAGELAVQLIGSAPVLPGDSFDVLKYTSRTGEFDAILNQTRFAGLLFLPTYSSTMLTLTTSALGGDANLDGFVNLSDFDILAANFGGSGNWLMADFTGDGLVNLSDFDVLAGNFGQSAAPGGPTPQDWAALASAVPEPTSALLMLSLGSIAARRSPRLGTTSSPRTRQ